MFLLFFAEMMKKKTVAMKSFEMITHTYESSKNRKSGDEVVIESNLDARVS